MAKYEVAFVFFIEREDTNRKNALVSDLNRINPITVSDIYDDGEDWNVECIAEFECNAKGHIDRALDHKLATLLKGKTYAAMDYHYMKGIDNDFYWHP
jgi:hypothetical protein